jgi:hypothetical protein
MVKKYTPEEIEKILQNLPGELKEAFFSLETAEVISNACATYGIKDERVGKIADYVGQVLMGLLLPSEFQKTIEKEVGLPRVLAKAITQEINRFIFYPVKPALEQLYKIEIAPSAEAVEKAKPKLEKPKVPRKKDIYREPIE